MKGFVLTSFDAPPEVRDDVAEPTPGEDQVLVRVHASSVNPVDAAIAGGFLQGMVEHQLPVVLGRDYAGVVERVGSGVTRYRAGDAVFGYLPVANPTVRDGSWQELVVVPEDNFVSAAPSGVDLAAAGAAAVAGITALLAVDALALSEGGTILIVGATGGVGTFAAQLAAHAGATVIAPALPEDEPYLRGLGVEELVERSGDVAAAVRELHPGGVDALLDLVSRTGDALEAHAAALAPEGRAASPLRAAGDAPGRANVSGVPSPENLQRLAGLLESGAVRVPIQHSYRLAEAGEALRALGSGHTQGKLAVDVLG